MTKLRTVNVALELTTDLPLKELKNKTNWNTWLLFTGDGHVSVRQITATVQEPAEKAKAVGRNDG